MTSSHVIFDLFLGHGSEDVDELPTIKSVGNFLLFHPHESQTIFREVFGQKETKPVLAYFSCESPWVPRKWTNGQGDF